MDATSCLKSVRNDNVIVIAMEGARAQHNIIIVITSVITSGIGTLIG